MSRKTHLFLAGLLALTVSGMAFASQQAAPNPHKYQKQDKELEKNSKTNPSQNDKWSQEKSACQGLDSRSKELQGQEKQLHQQAKQLEGQAVSLRRQAKEIEEQREAIEHSRQRGANNSGTNAEVKAMEQQRVALERQADEISKQREQIERQAHELNQQRRSEEAQHKQECGHGGHRKAS